MREIKFNAVNENTGEYIRFDDFIKSLKEENGFEYIEFRDDDTPNELLAKFLSCYYGFALLPYVGLKDKNGIEIYEGDMIKENVDDYPIVFIVEWNDISASFVLREFGVPDYYCRFNDEADSTDVNIIGNIYENKELLQEMKDV